MTANVGDALAERYRIVTTTQKIQADGVSIDARSVWSAQAVDELVARSKTHPHSLGTSSTEMVSLFRELVKTDKDVLVITTSRKLSGTYDATHAAERAIKSLQIGALNLRIVDSGTSDIGQGLVTLYAAACVEAGKTLDETARATTAFAATGQSVLMPLTFDYLVKGGRASFLKAMVATLIGKLPLISITNGELKADGTTSKNGNIAEAMVEHAAKKVGRGCRIWLGVGHAARPESAAKLVAAARKVFDVREMIVRELSPAIYMHMGAGGLCLTVYPIDGSPWPLSPGLF